MQVIREEALYTYHDSASAILFSAYARKKAFFFHSSYMNQYLLSSSGVQPSLYYHLFESRAKRYVNDDAPLFIDAADTKRYLSFNQLRSHVREFAAHLIDKGMKQGDIVAICAPGAVSVAMDEQYVLLLMIMTITTRSNIPLSCMV